MKLALRYLALFVSCMMGAGCTPCKVRVVPIENSEGSLNQWFYSIGIMDYGGTRASVESILRASNYCGSKYNLREIAWPSGWTVPPTKGPYFGIYREDRGPALGTTPVLVLITTQGVMTHAMKPMWQGSSWGLTALAGNPEVIDCAKSMQHPNETRFAEYYWKQMEAIESVLRKSKTLVEVGARLETAFMGMPHWSYSLVEGTERYQRFRDKAGRESFLTCGLESNIQWDKIYALCLTKEDNIFLYDGAYRQVPPPPLSASDWGRDLLANIYVNDGTVVGVLMKKSNYDGCLPEPYMAYRCGPQQQPTFMQLYSGSRYIYWLIQP